jgi:hypothetical protein
MHPKLHAPQPGSKVVCQPVLFGEGTRKTVGPLCQGQGRGRLTRAGHTPLRCSNDVKVASSAHGAWHDETASGRSRRPFVSTE